MDLDTISGLVISSLKKMPNVGDVVFLGNLCFTVEEVRNNRIEYVKLQLLDKRNI
jgi:CBS domain containing-hemolysin-like protein